MSKNGKGSACVELHEATGEMPEDSASRALSLLARWAARRARRLAEESEDRATVVELASYRPQNPEKQLAGTHTEGNMP